MKVERNHNKEPELLELEAHIAISISFSCHFSMEHLVHSVVEKSRSRKFQLSKKYTEGNFDLVQNKHCCSFSPLFFEQVLFFAVHKASSLSLIHIEENLPTSHRTGVMPDQSGVADTKD